MSSIKMKSNKKTESILEKKPDVVRTQIMRKDLTSIPDQLAQDKFYYLNYHLNDLKPHLEKGLIYCDRYYPYAEGGPLFMDIISSDLDSRKLEQKKEVMKTLGFRYVVIKKGMNLIEALESMA